MTDKLLPCPLGCVHLTGGDIRHLKECPNYPDSLSFMIDDLSNSKITKTELDKLLEIAEDNTIDTLNSLRNCGWVSKVDGSIIAIQEELAFINSIREKIHG